MLCTKCPKPPRPSLLRAKGNEVRRSGQSVASSRATGQRIPVIYGFYPVASPNSRDERSASGLRPERWKSEVHR